MPADINVFHLDQLSVHADFQNPNQYCTGFDYVLVGGEIAVAHDVWEKFQKRQDRAETTVISEEWKCPD